LRLLHKDVGLGREVGVPMRLANMAFGELTEAMNRGWRTRNSSVGQLLQAERSGIEPPAVDPKQVQAILDADKPKQAEAASTELPFYSPGRKFLRLLPYVIIRLIGQKAHGCCCIRGRWGSEL